MWWVDLFPPFHLGPTFQGLLEWTRACHMLSLLQTFIFLPWNDLSHLSSRPVLLVPTLKSKYHEQPLFQGPGNARAYG